MKGKLKFNMKALNWEKILIAVIVIMLIIAAFYAVKYFVGDDDSVPFEMLSEDQIPQKIQEILPRYKNLERALACKVDGEIFVITTRGEKPTGGYTIQIDRIEKFKEDDKTKMIVYTTFKDPKPGDIVTQVITYPYVVVKTDLKELPDKIELKIKYND
ncbi:protease complex subunit PrcB family protein [Marinisporobacter balticus]|uniref:Protease stability complex PrcB-like protein n=1 Tax=Marinisporobacter balticus TaxID=2018667 RepID=A0A4R2KH61_9FIRM|nr:protease complex subunit PrcB family protein [Marinisporobacter balticus]TCO73141.1 protease stability complex PrcB-like protein [Marinisporobacter balticus]